MTAAMFGVWHFWCTPPGSGGVVLARFVGWVLAKSMVETRGFPWAWLIQLPLDVLIFGFWAIGAVAEAQ